MKTILIAIVVLLLLVAALRLWLTANRLDRLHVRTEAAWAALEGALARRIVAARAVAAAGGLPPERAALLRGVARQADDAGRSQRAAAENELSRALAELGPVTPDLAGELADARERMALAQQFYNDAVRDTRALRDVWFTKLFRLAGSAAMPVFFQLTDYSSAGPPAGAPSPAGPASIDPSTLPQVRRSGRVVLLDDIGRVLLFHGVDPGRPDLPGFWFTPGGGVEPGEDELSCAVRELREETGLTIQPGQLGGPVWVRHAQFEFMGELLSSQETFFALRLPPGKNGIDSTGFTELERATIDDYRWWTPQELIEVAPVVYPVELPVRLGEVSDTVVATRRSTPAVID